MKKVVLINTNVLVTVVYFYGHHNCDQQMGLSHTNLCQLNYNLNFFLPVLTFSSPFLHIAPWLSSQSLILIAWLTSWSIQPILFQVLTMFFHIVSQRNEQGMWLLGFISILSTLQTLADFIHYYFSLNLCLW